MEIKFSIDKSERKALAQKIAEFTGTEVRYLGVPSCAYQAGDFTVSRDAVLIISDDTDKDTVELVLDWLREAGYTSESGNNENDEQESETEETEPEDSGEISETLNAEISFPMEQHTVQSLKNLVCMIHSRGALLSKATGGNFTADKTLIDQISQNEFGSVHELTAFIQEWGETNNPLAGISFESDKIIFDGFGQSEDAGCVQTFMKLAAAMNQMALTQKRVQAKEVDDSNEKYAFRTWLLRLGLNGADFKEDRRRLMANLSGNSAFRNDEEKARWIERQKAKREAQKAAAQQEIADTEGGEQHEVLDCD